MGPDTDTDHVKPAKPPPLLDLIRPYLVNPSESDPSNFSARVAEQKDMIIGSYDRKPAGLTTISRLSDVVRGIYWTVDSLSAPPPSLTRRIDDAEKWIKDVKTHRKIIAMEYNGLRCGNNYLVKLDDGTLACVKQRYNYDQIQGEIFAYFLADLLGMRHYLPPTVLVKAAHNRLFESVMEHINQSPSWDPTKPFIITKFLNHLKPLYVPHILHSLVRSLVSSTVARPGRTYDTHESIAFPSSPELSLIAGRSGTSTGSGGIRVDAGGTTENFEMVPVSSLPALPLITARSSELANMSVEDFRRLEQWSDLVIFDYLLGNLDRVVNNVVNLQWHQHMLSFPVRNVFQESEDGRFIFMDNESGLFHGYRLLDQYDKYLQPLLRAFCIFNKSTVNALRKLHENRNTGAVLMKMLQTEYPRLLNRLPGIGPKTAHILQKRIRYVYSHIRFCEENHYLP